MIIGDLKLSDMGRRIRIDLEDGHIEATIDGCQMASWLTSKPHSKATLTLKAGAWSTHGTYPLDTPCELLPQETDE